MQVTFLVGNGFDIALGLKSSYADFYKWYYDQKSDGQQIEAFKQDIKTDIEKNKGRNWSDFEIGLGKYTSKFSKDTIRDFLHCYDDVGKKMLDYLELESGRFEEDIDKTRIEAFRKGIANYLSNLQPKEQKEIENYFPQNGNYSVTVKMISFNYTSWLDAFVEKASVEPLRIWNTGVYQHTMSLEPDVIHAHGRINEWPIFGVNDESQVANKDLLTNATFHDIMIKPRSVVKNGQLWHEEAHNIIGKSDVICIFGMSIGATDSVWFEQIMEWLLANAAHHLILFWHTDNPSNGRSVLQMTENRRTARTKITDYSALTNEMIEALEDRIHVVENTKKLFSVKLSERAKIVNLKNVADRELQKNNA